MPKRFTATEKWSDRWFRNLSVTLKLGYLYLLDNCDVAGVLELDRDLANFQIGIVVEWDDLIAQSGGRIEILPSGRMWVTKFIEYQYGTLTETCAPHRAVLSILEKHSLKERVSKGYRRGSNTPKDKDKDKDKEKEGGIGGKPLRLVEVPAALSGYPKFNESWDAWLDHRVEIRHKATKRVQSESLKFLEELGPSRAVAAIRHSIRQGWQGIFEPDNKAANGSSENDLGGFAITDEAQLRAREGRA